MNDKRDWTTAVIRIAKGLFTINNLLWLIYICLLIVLWPHTAWGFNKFQEGQGVSIVWMAWALAFVFEAAVFGFTHKLKSRIEKASRLRQKVNEHSLAFAWRRFSTAYLSLYSLGLLLSSGVSTLANFSYAVEFSKPFKVYADYSLPPLLYELAFGGILPIASLLFAHVLADTVDTEDEPNEATVLMKQAKEEAKEAEKRAHFEINKIRREADGLRLEVNSLRLELEQAKEKSAILERLYADDKKVRIITARELFPDATGAAIASIAGVGPSYVSEVLNGKTANGSH